MKNHDEIRIFIVDDDRLMCKALKQEILNNFKNDNIRIFTFEVGEQVAAMIHNKPDIAIIDYHMNSVNKDAMNGVKIIELIKDKSPATEVILFTGDHNTGIAIEAFDRGVHDFIVKNEFMFRKINATLLQCLKLHELKLELRQQKKIGFFVIALISTLLLAITCIQLLAPHLFKSLN